MEVAIFSPKMIAMSTVKPVKFVTLVVFKFTGSTLLVGHSLQVLFYVKDITGNKSQMQHSINTT